MRSLSIGLVILGVTLASACEGDRRVVSPSEPARSHGPVFSHGGSHVTYRVQAFTSFNNQFYNIPPCIVSSTQNLSHWIGTGTPPPSHVDSLIWSIHVGSCSAPSPWNGGWVDVYEVRQNGDFYVGQVYGDMIWKDFVYAGPDYLQIRLTAFPDLTYPGGTCQFLYFDNYPPGQNSIVVTGQGDLPLAQFACTS